MPRRSSVAARFALGRAVMMPSAPSRISKRLYSDTEWYTAAVPMLDSARGKVTTLETQLAQPDTSKMQKFNFLMELGMHQDAIDLMIANDLLPSNEALIAMYDIGYLCEGDELTGRTYEAVELDGTTRELRFCDFGK